RRRDRVGQGAGFAVAAVRVNDGRNTLFPEQTADILAEWHAVEQRIHVVGVIDETDVTAQLAAEIIIAPQYRVETRVNRAPLLGVVNDVVLRRIRAVRREVREREEVQYRLSHRTDAVERNPVVRELLVPVRWIQHLQQTAIIVQAPREVATSLQRGRRVF